MVLPRSLPRAMPPRWSRAASSRASFLAQRATPSVTAAAVSSYSARATRKQQHFFRSLLAIAVAGGAATLSQYYIHNGSLIGVAHAETPPKDDDEGGLVFEQSKTKAGVSKEENRDNISSQHLQVKRSWENPGVYAWGSNTGRVVAPDSAENVIKTPRRIPFFDGKLLRDIQMDRNFGAAIDERGDLLQWGTAYAPDTRVPVPTLQGKNLTAITLSRDRILALSRSGTVYSLPVSAEDQASGAKPSEASWIPFWSRTSPVAYRTLAPKDLAYSEKITAVASGLEHALLLTSTGRLFSTAAASDTFPARGQLGVPGLTWTTRPEGAYDQLHELATLRGFPLTQIACGDHHSLALDRDGRVFTWGDNSSGQLGFDTSAETSLVDAPSLLPIQKLYTGTSQVPTVTRIAAGGQTSYLTVDAIKVASPTAPPNSTPGLGRITADTFAFGSGIHGSLANNRWTHVQSTPIRIPTPSGLFEYDEQTSTTVPIRLAHLSAGNTHAAAVLANITYTSASAQTSAADTNWGADVVFWGGNEHFQLGTGRRNNAPAPLYLAPLDRGAETKRAKKTAAPGVKEGEHRFHITPRTEAVIGDGRRVSVEQRVSCGRGVTCVYSGT